MKLSVVSGLLLALLSSSAGAATVSPPSWWVGMESAELQLMIHEPDIAKATASIDYPGITVKSTHALESKNYLFVDVTINDETQAGYFDIELTLPDGTKKVLPYQLESRVNGSAQRQGFSSKDVIYLITPDRFANGDPKNDQLDDYVDKHDRESAGGRHGGDIQGITDHLSYFRDMGYTQIWTMPMMENAMDSYSYHGYAITDHYAVDPRYGSNTDYAALSQEAKEYGIGVIIDLVLNHIGSQHPWMQDMPSKDWINNGGVFTPTTHRREALHDPHGVSADVEAFADGWFVPTMPDLNQRVPELSTFLIQHAIWWVEYAQLSGIRVDTYSYSDKGFLSRWTQRLMQEYPNLNIVGEEWSTNPNITAYWQAGTSRHDGYESALPSVMDFPLQTTLINALTAEENWGSGLRSLYELLAADFVYGDPYNLVVFNDNHDMSRVFTQVNEDYDLWDMAMTTMLTMRGIPQIFYGTEILMANPGTEDHGIIRSDFPGGWSDDKINAFSGSGLSSLQKQAQQRIKTLLTYRAQSDAITQGRFTQYAPQNGIYVYFRHYNDDKVMVVLNKNEKDVDLTLSRFKEMLAGHNTATSLFDETTQSLASTLSVPARKAVVYTIK